MAPQCGAIRVHLCIVVYRLCACYQKIRNIYFSYYCDSDVVFLYLHVSYGTFMLFFVFHAPVSLSFNMQTLR